MKTKLKRKIPAPRNPYVAAAMFKKAGAHVKPEKAKRRAAAVEMQKYPGCSSKVEHSAFNRSAKIRFLPPRPDHVLTKILP